MRRGKRAAAVGGLLRGPRTFESIARAPADGQLDDVVISTLPKRVSKWLRRDLIRRVEGLGLPVTAVVPTTAKLSREGQLELGIGGGLGGI